MKVDLSDLERHETARVQTLDLQGLMTKCSLARVQLLNRMANTNRSIPGVLISFSTAAIQILITRLPSSSISD